MVCGVRANLWQVPVSAGKGQPPSLMVVLKSGVPLELFHCSCHQVLNELFRELRLYIMSSLNLYISSSRGALGFTVLILFLFIHLF